MSKQPISIDRLKAVVRTSQAIEGYKEATPEIKKNVSELKAKYGIKVSAKR